MSSPNRRQAQQAFGRTLAEAKDTLHQQILKLRMHMIQFPKTGNAEPEKWSSACKQVHNQLARTADEWRHDQREREACDECSAATASYWNHDQWGKTRGNIIATLRYRLRDYKIARKHYWAAGGHTSIGADRFT